MANHSVSANKLTEGSLIVIKGTIEYSRLVRRIDGEELRAADARAKQRGGYPVGAPHTRAVLANAEIQPLDPSGTLSLEETYVAERRYQKADAPEKGNLFSINSKGNVLPNIMVPGPDGKHVQDTSGKELANGLSVRLILRVYKAGDQANRGLALDTVVVDEPVRYYTGASINIDELTARGFTFAAAPVPVTADSAQASGDAPIAEGADLSDGTQVDENGWAMPAPGAAAPVAQATAPVQQAPAVQAPVQAAPVQQAAPAQDDIDAQIAALQAQKAQQAAQQGGAVPAQPAADSPWGGQGPAQPGISIPA